MHTVNQPPLMDVMFKGYAVPEVPGRLVSFGMSISKDYREDKSEKVYGRITRQLREALAKRNDWMSAREMAEAIRVPPNSIRGTIANMYNGNIIARKHNKKSGIWVYKLK